MKNKKLISLLLACSMAAVSTAALAAAPSAYDGQTYESMGVDSNDPDGEFNLAVIANGDVNIYGDTMYIEGSVYSNGTIYGGNGAGNVIKGMFISATENQTETGDGDATAIRYGYIHVDDDGNVDVTNAYSTGIEHEGAILDKNTSFDYSYTEYTYPEISNYIKTAVANQYSNVTTVREDTHFGTITASSAGLIINASENDVTIVVDKLIVDGNNPYIQVYGDYHVNLYVKNWVQGDGTTVNLELASGDINNGWDTVDQWAYISNSIYAMDSDGVPRPNYTVLDELDPSKIDFYVNTESGTVNFQGARVAANIHSNASTLTFGNNLEIYGDIESGAATFETIGSGYINGTVSVPYADSTIHNSSCIQGQLITDTLLINGAGAILNQTDSIKLDSDTEPTETNAPSNIYLDIEEDVIYIPIGGSADLHISHNTTYDWDFNGTGNDVLNFQSGGIKNETTGDSGDLVYLINSYYVDTEWTITPQDHDVSKLTAGREFTLKVISREDPNVFDTVKVIIVDASEPEPLPEGDEVDLSGVGYAYIFGYEPAISYVYDEETGGHLVAEVQMAPNDAVTREQVASMIMRLIDQKYDTKNANYPLTANIAQHDGTWYARGLAYLAGKGTFDGIDTVECGPVTRGEVAKLVAYGLNLSNTTTTAFADIADNQYKSYIEIVNAYGYMEGISDTEFQPDRIMTRAEFCSMFNQIIDRTDALLEGADGTQVTPELYSIVDLDADAWYTPVMLRATSAYDSNGYVDIETRLSNIRNILDNYDAQKWF